MAVAVAALAAVALLGLSAAVASAATTYGNDCEAHESIPQEVTLYEVIGALHVHAGVESSGVITRWQLNVHGVPSSITQRLKVIRWAPDQAGEDIVSGESAVETVADADAGVSTRIPVVRDNFIGLSSQGEDGAAFVCTGQSPEEIVASSPGDLPVESQAKFTQVGLRYALPVQVTIEPDADGDGYGDESQDACPADPNAHLFPCPGPPTATPPAPRPNGRAVAHRGEVTVTASTDVAGPVTVSGIVKLGKGKKSKVKLNGGTQTLAAGQQGSFTLKFTEKLKAKLAVLPEERKLTLAVTVSAANSAGVAATQALTVKLKGQG